MDQEKIKQAATLFLEGIGEDPNREGLIDTPERVAKMCETLFAGMNDTAEEHLSRTFSIESNDMVLERDIPFYSICEHHILPFYGKVHIAYVPNGRVVGLSKLARTVEVFARRLQMQERMTEQIADAIMETLQPAGVMVVVSAEHMCMSMRGVQKPGTKTFTAAKRGCFAEIPALEKEFYRLLKLGGTL